MKFSGFVTGLFFLLFQHPAWPYPELVRHGYSTCLACHVSATGGGILSEYGRELSRELLSTWGKAKETKPLHGLVKIPKKFAIGGDYRTLQVTQSTPQFESGYLFNMQLDIEAAYYYKKRTVAVAAIGKKISGTKGENNSIFSHRHFVSYNYSDSTNIRLGRFYPEYGIYNPNHRRFVRQYFGFDSYYETYNAEVNYNTESYNVFLTAILGRPEISEDEIDPGLQRERRGSGHSGLALTGNYFLLEKHRVGASFRQGSLDKESYSQEALYAIFGFTKSLYLMAEMDWRKEKFDTIKTDLSANLLHMGFEFYKGWHIYGLHQEFHREDNVGSVPYDLVANGLGVQIFPRPHWELVFEYQTRNVPPSGNFEEDYYYFLLHYYL